MPFSVLRQVQSPTPIPVNAMTKEQAVADHELGKPDQDPGRKRQAFPQRHQQRLDTREQEEEKDQDDDQGDEDDEDRIGQRGEDLGAHLGALLQVDHQALQDDIEAAGGLARLDQADRGLIKDPAVFLHGLGKGLALAELIPGGLGQGPQAHIGQTPGQQADRVAHLDAAGKQVGQGPEQGQHLPATEAGAAGSLWSMLR